MSELLVILVIVLLIFGAGKLPQIGDALGRSIRNFKRAASSGEGEGDAAKREIEAGKRGELGAGRPEAQDAEIVAVKTETKKS